MDLSKYRTQYEGEDLKEPLPDAPWDLLKNWVRRALLEKKVFEPNAMSLATVDAEGQPSVRIVLFKEVSDEGLVFYTNYDSQKGKEIANNPKVAAAMWWPEIFRQIRISGIAEKISPEKSTEYFHSRPKGSQLGAVASLQSSVIDSRDALFDNLDKVREKYKDQENVDRPENWGGYFIKIESVEFWQGQPNRLHDRIRYRKQGEKWVRERLAP